MLKIYILLFCIYCFLSGYVISRDKDVFLSSIVTLAAFSIVCFEIWYLSTRDGGSISWVVNTLKYVAVLCALQTIFFGQDYYNGVFVTTMSADNNPNILGYVMVVGIFCVLLTFKSTKALWIIDVVFIFAELYTIILSGSRKCLISALIICVFWFVIYMRFGSRQKRTIKSMVSSLVLTVSVFVGGYLLFSTYSSTASFERMLLLFDEGGVDGRIGLFNIAIEYWQTSPLIGIGYDQFKVWYYEGFYSHSTYGELLSCTGIVGFVLFLTPVLMLLIQLVKRGLNQRENHYLIFMMVTMLLVELFLAAGQIVFYNMTHMALLFVLSWSEKNGIYGKELVDEA